MLPRAACWKRRPPLPRVVLDLEGKTVVLGAGHPAKQSHACQGGAAQQRLRGSTVAAPRRRTAGHPQAVSKDEALTVILIA